MKYKVNDLISYTNGNMGVYTGKVMRIGTSDHLTVIDPTNLAQVTLWEAGYAVGSYIHVSQIVK